MRQRNEIQKQNEKTQIKKNKKGANLMSNVTDIMNLKHSSESNVSDAYHTAKEQESKFKAAVTKYNMTQSKMGN